MKRKERREKNLGNKSKILNKSYRKKKKKVKTRKIRIKQIKKEKRE